MSRAKWIWASAVGLALIVTGSMVLVGATRQDSGIDSVGGSGAGAASREAASPEDGSPGSAASGSGGDIPVATPSIDVSQLKRGDLSLELSVEPGCARHGGAMTARLTAVPGAYVSLIVGYADGQSFGTWYAGPTGVDGTLTYPWIVPPTAAVGRGHVFASGHDPATERSGTVAAAFQIAGAQGC